MSRAISLFSGYSQKENRTTNYCLLILKLLYEENPKFLGELLSALLGEDLGDHVGVQFRQQERRGKSVPDGLIIQKALSIYIETKTFDWFYDGEIERQLEALDKESDGLKVLVALGNFEFLEKDRFATIQHLCATHYAGRILFAATGFADLTGALQELALPKNLADTVEEFRMFLDDEGLLPNWQYRMDVVNCASAELGSEPEDGAYLCPATGGAYKHKRSKFFGAYRDKHVRLVALIDAVVDLKSPTEHQLLWQNNPESEENLVMRAREKHARFRPDRYPTRVFLLGESAPTDFRKDTPRGMQGSKQYFWVNADSASDLATQLNGRTWSSWKGG